MNLGLKYVDGRTLHSTGPRLAAAHRAVERAAAQRVEQGRLASPAAPHHGRHAARRHLRHVHTIA